MSKRILLSGGVIAFVAAVALGATYAAWTAYQDVTGNTVSAAEIKLKLIDGPNNFDMQKPLTASNLFPGQSTETATVRVVNESSVPVGVYMKLKDVTETKPGFCAALTLAVNLGTVSPTPADPASVSIDIAGGQVFKLGNLPAFQGNDNPYRTVSQFATLDSNADNSLQGGNCTWTEEFYISTEQNDLGDFYI